MRAVIATTGFRSATIPLLAMMYVAASSPSARAAGCLFEPQGEGRVAEIIDIRTFRLQDGREVRLAGIEPIAAGSKTADAASALTALIAGRDVTLHGESDTPDRYGRQPAFVFLDPSAASVQGQLLAQGETLISATVSDKDCAAELAIAEAAARKARRGIWGRSTVIKNAESPGDILADIGQFAVVEGRVLSVRQAGATTYINFGRRWTQDFAVTISRRMMASLETTGITPKSFERRRIRVRGWVEKRGGPRIEVLRVGQIEVVGDD
ncbi:endonuclease YncB(thermonuclease family) [Nitrobacteraceae bacterium AZCC 2161]